MQRFKKEFSLDNGTSTETVLRMIKCSDRKSGKFVYGANGTLTQAARWRIEAIGMIDGMHKATHIGAWAMHNIIHPVNDDFGSIRSLLDSAKRGGCYLP
jgi:hypothetical protein